MQQAPKHLNMAHLWPDGKCSVPQLGLSILAADTTRSVIGTSSLLVTIKINSAHKSKVRLVTNKSEQQLPFLLAL